MCNRHLLAIIDCALTLSALDFDVQAHIDEVAKYVFLARFTEEQEDDFLWLKRDSLNEITLENMLNEWDGDYMQAPAPEVFTVALQPDGLMPPPSVDEPDWLRQFVPYYNEKLMCLLSCENTQNEEA